MNIVLDWINIIAMLVALSASVIVFYVLRKRKQKVSKTPLALEDFVTLDSQGWALVSGFAAVGAIVMIASSAAIGIAYWTGLAIDGDIAGGVITPGPDGEIPFFRMLTVGVVGFFFLALVFETFSDLGVPLASGMAGRKKPLLPQLILAATLGCIVMSVVTKWGYYDDKREYRVTQLEQEVEADTQWHDAKDKAEATILRLGSTPSLKVADARLSAAEATIARLETQIKNAEDALALIPPSHSTNRNNAQAEVNRLYDKLAEAEAEKIAVEGIKENRAELDAAELALAAANAKILELVGSAESDGSVRVKAGDAAFVRVFRVGIHQFLCWLFPMLWFEGRAAYRDVKKKELAAEKRRATMADKNNTFEADFEEAVAADPIKIEVADKYFDDKRDKEAAEIAAMMEDRGTEGAEDAAEAEAVANKAYDPAKDKGKA
jgi:hypothetical protein